MMKYAFILSAGAVALIAGCAGGGSQGPTATLPTAGATHGPAQPALDLVRVVSGQRPAVRYFDTPTQAAWPEYITRGPQRALWFSEFFADSIGRVTSDGKMTEFPLPTGDDVEGITEGGDGNIWFSEPGANKIGRMTPQGVVTSFPIMGDDPDPRGITLGPDGNVWYTEFYDGYIGRVTPQGVITRFEIPDYAPYAWAITTGPDGDLWFSESEDDVIGRFDPRTQQFKASLQVPTQDATPWGLLLAPDKHVWFTERNGDKIAEVVGKTIREFKINVPGSYPEALAPGSDGDLWFTMSQAGEVGHIDPVTGKIGSLLKLTSGSIPNGIAAGFNKNLWFTVDSYTNPSQIGELVLR